MTANGSAITVVAPFEIITSDGLESEAGTGGGAALSRTILTKRFSGALDATSVTHMLAAVASTGRGYVAHERIDGMLDGRRGTFVLQHGGLADADDVTAFGDVIPGSGTGELSGLRGHARYQHDGATAVLTLTYRLDGVQTSPAGATPDVRS